MSLAKVLGAKAVDSGLDDIFKSSAGPSTLILPTIVRPVEEHTRKRKTDASSPAEEASSKKTRASKDDVKKSKHEVKEKKGKKAEAAVSEHEETIVEVKVSKGKDAVLSDAPDSDDESDQDAPLPEHESHKKSNRKKAGAKKTKFVPDGETREQRDARSIFIGNLPVAVVKSKAMTKQLRRHIISHVPSASIESIRYRSVAFLNPTSALEPEDGSTKPKPSTKQLRQKERASNWRDQKPDAGWAGGASKREEEEAAEDRKGMKDYMTPAAKRRLAAIKGDVHEHEAATTNAYVVFAYPFPLAPDSEVNVPRKEVMDPTEAARLAVRAVDGTLFEEHVIRVDVAGKASAEEGAKKDEGVGALTDPKMSIFVGNLDFASSEDDVRAFFEKVMCDERGNPAEVTTTADNTEKEEDEEPNSETKALRKSTWVTRVRIVRDRETQLGKGFAYVQFSDRDCVDEVLALEAEKLKFAKRILRVQRCKASGASTKLKKSSSLPKSKATAGVTTNPRARSQSAVAVEVPKGDPSLGARLAGLTKASRKEAKAADQARLARRLAKKKARAALEKAGVKEKRVRERKDKNKKGIVNTGRKEGRKRVRSEKNGERRNAKK